MIKISSNYICILVLLTLKIATRLAETSWWPPCNNITSIKLKCIRWYNVCGSVHRKNISLYIQQDATLHSLFYLETALHVSGGTSTHHHERIQLYLQHLVFVTPLLLPALIAASSSNGVTKRKSFGHRSSRLNAHRHTLQYLVQRKRERERERKREREITESENCRENKKWKREAKLLENKRINFVMRLIAKHFCGLWPHTWENRLSFSLTQECLSSKQHLKFAVL